MLDIRVKLGDSVPGLHPATYRQRIRNRFKGRAPPVRVLKGEHLPVNYGSSKNYLPLIGGKDAPTCFQCKVNAAVPGSPAGSRFLKAPNHGKLPLHRGLPGRRPPRKS